jgi:hypothetical protein
MPLLTTPRWRSAVWPCSRRARKSGHRWFASAVVTAPSVIESPKATTDAARWVAATLTPERKCHDAVVVAPVSVGERVALPAAM